jgi:sodium/bile acid cotransporter 7
MLFHQIQLVVCAALARRWGGRDRRPDERAAAARPLAAAGTAGG